MHPTPHPDVNHVVGLLAGLQTSVLGSSLVGVYLGGSIALGDFDPGSSDIDLLAITEEPVTGDALEQLRRIHEQVGAAGLHWASHLEVSYIPRAAVRRYDPENSSHPSVGVTWSFGVHPHDESWVLQNWILREKGIPVMGPPPDGLIDPVTEPELKCAVEHLLRTAWTGWLHNPEWLRPRNYQAYAILTMCRAQYTLHSGGIVSKPVAAAWAMQALPERAGLIRRALRWRYDTRPDDLEEMLGFVRETIESAGA